ncbi:class I SAM-dependent methyltransferase [Ilyomonas limi]|uniref:Class I SAM-dependent methyltransferase n=1 Tax=Ilyomonas limi TaxID=2575867 RepID=A0A4U3L3P3_9BACT|nr:class I SAM-dependent methyltransferase [Ilyomonas limi]TKK68919.1 class I SAM-dependent methyltransferase [Ilyomonas limi]
MKSLREIFDNHNGRLIHKWDHYIEIYDQYFSKFRDREINILEIGLSQGGSIDMWKEYFGSKANIFGIDINPDSKTFEEEKVKVFIGSQDDKKFLNDVRKKLPPLDILIDDGGHTMKQQIFTFEALFDIVKPDGIYLCEDVQTSYWKLYHGKYKRSSTFIEYSKNFIDQMHAWFSEEPNKFKVDYLTRNIKAIHYYTNMVFIEKENMTEPFEVKKGTVTVGFQGETGADALNLPLKTKVMRKLKKIKNRLKR